MTDYGIDTIQFRARIVRPVLHALRLWSPAAECLVMGTAMHESHLQYLKQLGQGPALGVFQMEPATYTDIWNNFLAYQAELARLVSQFSISNPDAQEMEGNLYFATAMCRVHYRRVKDVLPPHHQARALAEYWKKHYNTVLGKGTVEQALPHFELAVKEFSI